MILLDNLIFFELVAPGRKCERQDKIEIDGLDEDIRLISRRGTLYFLAGKQYVLLYVVTYNDRRVVPFSWSCLFLSSLASFTPIYRPLQLDCSQILKVCLSTGILYIF